MSILVNINSEQEEKLLIAFLNDRQYDDKSDGEDGQELTTAFLDEDNREIDEADAEIESGNYVAHHEAEALLANRRKNS